jgi:hypothetical protein
MRYLKTMLSKLVYLYSIQINSVGKNAAMLYKEIDEIFQLEERINFKSYMKVVKQQSSDLFMMVFYYLRKITKLVDDCIIPKPRANSMGGKDKIANAKLVNLRAFSPEIDRRTVLRSSKRPINNNDDSAEVSLSFSNSKKVLPRIDINKDTIGLYNDLSSSRGSIKSGRQGKINDINSMTPDSKIRIIKTKGRIGSIPEYNNKDEYYNSRNNFRKIPNYLPNDTSRSRQGSQDSERGRNTLSNSAHKTKPKVINSKGNVLNIFTKKQSLNINPLNLKENLIDNLRDKENNNPLPSARKQLSSNLPTQVDSNKTLSLYSGYIYKFNTTQTELKKYWFVLKNYKLLYFSDKEKKTPSGLINLIKCFLKKDGKVNIFNKPYYCFHLYHNLHRESFFVEEDSNYENWVVNINNFCETKETINNYKIIEFIGQGKFSVVHRGIRIDNHNEVAVKIIRKTKMEDVDLECTRREVSILQITEHPHIIKMKSFYENYEYIYIIQELFPSTDLFDYLQNHEFNIAEDSAKIIMKQLISAVDYLHKIGIVHRDIKPENILIREIVNKSNLKKEILIKCIDFGLSRFLAQNELVRDEPFGTMVRYSLTLVLCCS